MIVKYVFGTPIETTAVVGKYMSAQDPMPFFSLDKPTEKTLSFCYKMHCTDIVYGLGQAVRGINKRGWKYESYCTDDPNHTETKHALYGAHNFLLVSGDQTLFGAFFDTPSRIALYHKQPARPCTLYSDRSNGGRGCRSVPAACWKKLCPTALGVWVPTKPVGVSKRTGYRGRGRRLPSIRHPFRCNLFGYRLYGAL